MRELLRIAHDVEPGDETVVDPHRDDIVDLPVEPDDQRRAAIDLHRLDRYLTDDPGYADSQQPGHPRGPHDGPQQSLLDAAAVAEEEDVGREDVDEGLQVARF